MTEKHQRLMQLTNEAIEKAEEVYRADTKAFGGVNWADLSAHEVLRCEDQDGKISWRVLVEEAHCERLESFIFRYIDDRAPEEFPGLEVRTEW